jgi:hypothetical protein
MPSFAIRNENFRDEALKHNYPFGERALLEDNGVFIGSDTFVDASFFMKTEVQLPLYISRLDGTDSVLQDLRIEISDAAGDIVGNAYATFDSEVLEVEDGGVHVGTLLMNLPGLRRLIGRTAGRFYDLDALVAPFSLDVSSTSVRKGLRYVQVGDAITFGAVKVVARHGVTFEMSLAGKLSINVLGTTEPLAGEPRQPLRSINQVVNPSIWLANDPESNIRVVTTPDAIVFTKAKEVK